MVACQKYPRTTAFLIILIITTISLIFIKTKLLDKKKYVLNLINNNINYNNILHTHTHTYLYIVINKILV